jgi:hypothetical protein
VTASALQGKHGQSVDRESAYELLTGRLAESGTAATESAPESTDGLPPVTSDPIPIPEPYHPYDDVPATAPVGQTAPAGGFLGDMMSSPVVTSFMRSLGTSLGGAFGRSISGTRTRSRKRR